MVTELLSAKYMKATLGTCWDMLIVLTWFVMDWSHLWVNRKIKNHLKC